MAMRIRRLVVVCVAVIASCVVQAQDVSRMDAVVRSYADTRAFMGAVLVARDGQVLFDKAYGFANLEWNIANTTSTKFRLGSVTKQFTAASILLLEERGKLKTSDPVGKYMPDAPGAWSGITLFHLLTHTSGIPNFTAFPEYRQLERFDTPVRDVIAKFRDRPLDFTPGEKMLYSNSGYVVLGYLVEKISGQSYETFVQENIFTPLDMKDTGYDSNTRLIPQRAAGYTPAPGGLRNADFVHMSVPHGAGALYSTTHDLLLWEQGLFGGKLLSAPSLAKMTTPFKSDYGLGVMVQVVNGRRQVSHGGSIEGFNTSLVYYPDSRVTVVSLGNVNGNAPDRMTDQLGRLVHGEAVVLAGERTEVPVARDILARYVGTYQLAPQVSMMMTLDGNQLMTQLSGQPRLPVFPQSETLFFLKVVDAQVEFVKDEKGAVSAAILHQNGRDQRAPRVSDTVLERREVKVAPAVLASYVGTYTLRPGAELAVTVENGQLVTQLGPQPKVPFFAESETRFFARMVDAQIEFRKDTTGAVSGLALHQGPVNLEAQRKAP